MHLFDEELMTVVKPFLAVQEMMANRSLETKSRQRTVSLDSSIHGHGTKEISTWFRGIFREPFQVQQFQNCRISATAITNMCALIAKRPFYNKICSQGIP